MNADGAALHEDRTEAKLLHVLDAYLADRDAGRAGDPAALLAAHPDIADGLRACLEVIGLADRMGGKRPAGHFTTSERDELDDATRRAATTVDPAPNSPFGSTETALDPGLGQLGDFRLLREIGRGGMGVVYEAEQISLGRRVALKVLPRIAALDSRQLRRFQIEAHAAAQLHHPHIVPVHAVGSEHGQHYYAMQVIDGCTVAELIRELRRQDDRPTPAESDPAPAALTLATALATGQFPPAPPPASTVDLHPDPGTTSAPPTRSAEPARARDPKKTPGSSHAAQTRAFLRSVAGLGIEAAEALEYAHQEGVVHRDIKPANLMLDAQGRLWITDFGLARLKDDSGLTDSGDVIGTPGYMSPEQTRGGGQAVVDHRTDIYSLGVTLYELLALEPAFAGADRAETLRRILQDEHRPLRRLNPAIPRELETIVHKAIAKEPSDRYATARALAEDLRRFLEDRPIAARRPSVTEHLARWVRRHGAAALGAVLVLIFMAGVLAVSAAVFRHQRDTARSLRSIRRRTFRGCSNRSTG